MDRRREMMETALADSLRELMQRMLFEKITIKQICDRTGVIRATFYNHFEDKYDCLNWIIYHDLFEGSSLEEEHDDYSEALTRALGRIEENREFYRAAFNVTGQNSFEDMLRDNLRLYVRNYLDRYRKAEYLSQYDNDLLAGYYAETLAYCIRIFIFDRSGEKSVDDIRQMVLDLTHHSVVDFLRSE